MAKSVKERKEAQRIRDKKPGARHEKTYRATEPEHKVLKKKLIDMRLPF